MPSIAADLRIEARWIAPMTAQNALLTDHSMMVRDGRILEILPTATAAVRYSAAAVLQRNAHLLMPGMINAKSASAALLLRGANGDDAAELAGGADFARDGTLASIAEMLKSGVTCFCDRSFFPEETVRAAHEQGMRAMVAMPVTDAPTPWAHDAAQSLSRGLKLRDQFKTEPLISTAFAPLEPNLLSDASFARLVTLADELDAGVLIDLHQSKAEIEQCQATYGRRPIERLWNLGLLTPALNAAHVVHLTDSDLSLMQRTGISVTLCPQNDMKLGHGLPPVAALSAAAIRLSLGSGGAAPLGHDLWSDMRITGLLSNAWAALSAATRGGAAVLGLESDIGTLEAGKWADLCCVDLSGPGTQPVGEPVAQIVFAGGRDLVSDVWVAGRQLLSGGELTRLDWAEVSARSAAWAARMKGG
jgi:5-methylthioadenosine/S-adenosylhomocysteine deaminase